MSITPSTPFSSGTEYEWFKCIYCEKCKRYKTREDGFPEFPENGGCEILDAMEYARFDISKFPNEEIVELRDAFDDRIIRWHFCKKYTANDENYKECFDELRRALFK